MLNYKNPETKKEFIKRAMEFLFREESKSVLGLIQTQLSDLEIRGLVALADKVSEVIAKEKATQGMAILIFTTMITDLMAEMMMDSVNEKNQISPDQRLN
jgi:hypothetical protein